LNAKDGDRNAHKGRMPSAMYGESGSDDDDAERIAREMRRTRMNQQHEMQEAGNEEEDYMDMGDNQKGRISEWLKEKKTINFIRNSFGKFLRHFKDESGNEVYENWIHDMCTNNKSSFEVTYGHISLKMPTLAIWIAESPNGVVPILN